MIVMNEDYKTTTILLIENHEHAQEVNEFFCKILHKLISRIDTNWNCYGLI